jgi:hypothetical protein
MCAETVARELCSSEARANAGSESRTVVVVDVVIDKESRQLEAGYYN